MTYSFTYLKVISFSFSGVKVKVKQALYRPGQALRFQKVGDPKYLDIQHVNVVILSALCTNCLCLPGNITGTHFCWRLSQLQEHSGPRRIKSVKNTIDTIGN